MIYDMLNVLQNEYQKQFSHQPEIRQQAESLNKDSWKKDYKKLMDRQKCCKLPPYMHQKIYKYIYFYICSKFGRPNRSLHK